LIEYIVNSEKSVRELSRELGISSSVISYWRIKAGKRVRYNKIKKWSEKEIKFLLENYPRLSVEEIAKRLGRTRWSVYYKLKRMLFNDFYPVLIDDEYVELPYEDIEHLLLNDMLSPSSLQPAMYSIKICKLVLGYYRRRWNIEL